MKLFHRRHWETLVFIQAARLAFMIGAGRGSLYDDS